MEYAKKLVAKTHSGPQPQDQILGGVFNSLSWVGDVKLSAVKQFGLLQGDRAGYEATELAKQIAAAPDEELPPLLQRACLTPPIFKALFETFHNDEVSLAKIRQVAAHQKVHIDSADKCVDLFVASTEFAGLGSRNGETVKFSARDSGSSDSENAPSNEDEGGAANVQGERDSDDNTNKRRSSKDVQAMAATTELPPPSSRSRVNPVQVNITIDPTMDPEKLERHLKLLRGYGIC
ncbi:MAG: hypothetical protein DME97_04005 [Verrucomicrobia bacterium]|nr:MAG: hypothetical protein DME97_04005 [Verrucomicrobiota bacterium]